MYRQVLIILSFVFCINVFPQDVNIDILFENAKTLNTGGKYSEAAEAFILVQTEAYRINDIENYIQSIIAQGECYYQLGATYEINELIERAIKTYKKHTRDLDRITGLKIKEAIFKLKGSYYSLLTDYDESAYEKAYDAFQYCMTLLDTLKNESDVYNEELEYMIHRQLLTLYYKQKNWNKSLEVAELIFNFRNDIGFDELRANIKTENYVNFIDSYVSYAMVLARLKKFNEAIQVLGQLPIQCSAEPSVIRAKGKILMLQYAFEKKDNRKLAHKYYKTYVQHLKKEIEYQIQHLDQSKLEQYWLTMHSFLYDCYCLEDYSTNMLYDLALYSKGYLLERSKKQSVITWEDIRSKLSSNECAIEFVQYKNHLDEKQLAAFVLKKEFKHPHFIKIGSVKDLEDYILPSGQTLKKVIECDFAASKDALYNDSVLFSKIWTPELLRYIGNSTSIYFSPDGCLHQLGIEYMYPEVEIDIYRLSSTRQLLRNKDNSIDSLLIVGGVNFVTDTSFESEGNDAVGYKKLKQKSPYFNYLYGSAIEVDSICDRLSDANLNQYTVLKGESATDVCFSNMVQHGYSVVHVATHGYFLGELNFTDLQPPQIDCCLTESGIIMAGAGTNLSSQSFNPQYQDGIITAKEIAETNLSNIKLMVLSTCQSGLGRITPDGVYGIQRALKIAGVDAMIVSLWSVDDWATSEFMNKFYAEYCSSGDIYKSFKNARLKMIHTKDNENSYFSPGTLSRKKSSRNFSSPQYTNAFILIDAL